MVRYLVNYGADLDMMDDEYNMAIDYAKLCKNRDVYNLIYYKILKTCVYSRSYMREGQGRRARKR